MILKPNVNKMNKKNVDTQSTYIQLSFFVYVATQVLPKHNVQ